MRWLVGLALITLLLSGCRSPVLLAPLPEAELPADYPAFIVSEGRSPSAVLWTLDPSRSDLEIRVYRDGAMARLGHNHVIHAEKMTGRAQILEGNRLQADLLVPVAQLVVDAPPRRSQAGEDFESLLDDKDRQGTRQNMLSASQLDGQRFPWLRARIDAHIDDSIPVAFEVAGTRFRTPIAVSIEHSGSDLIARGQLTLSHAQLGLEVFTAGGGLVRVAEQLDVRFELIFQITRP